MKRPKNYWTIGTRDLRTLLSLEFATAAAATAYRDSENYEGWIVVRVAETETGRAYQSPEMPGGPEYSPAPGSF